MSYPPPPNQQPFPQYPQGGGYGGPPKHLRGRTPLLLALIFLVVAVALFVVGGVVLGTKSLGTVNSFKRVSIANGGGTVTLNGTGKWIGYYEADNVSNNISQIPHFQVGVTSPSGKNVGLQTYGNRGDGKIQKLTYDYNGHKGIASFQFNASEKGTYKIQLRAVDSLPSGAGVAVGRDIVTATIAGGLLILGGVLFLIAAIVLFIVGLVRRSRHKKELAAGSYGGGPPPNYPPPNYPPPNYPPPNYPPPGQQPPGAWPAPQP